MKFCIDCAHYKPRYQLDRSCKKFLYYQNMVTGKVLFEDAELCRQVQAKCGKEAKHFEPRKGFFKKLCERIKFR